MRINVRLPLKKQANTYAVYQEKADDNEEELLKKMQNLVVKHEATTSGAGMAIKRFAKGFKSSSKINKPKTFSL